MNGNRAASLATIDFERRRSIEKMDAMFSGRPLWKRLYIVGESMDYVFESVVKVLVAGAPSDATGLFFEHRATDYPSGADFYIFSSMGPIAHASTCYLLAKTPHTALSVHSHQPLTNEGIVRATLSRIVHEQMDASPLSLASEFLCANL